MKKYEGILICSDLDCTLADRQGKGHISEENIAALNYFMSEGGLFALATGRQRKFLREIEKKLRFNAPLILINGTLVDDNGKIIYSKPMEKQDFEVCLEIMEKYPFMREAHLRAVGDSQIYKNTDGKMVCTYEAKGPYYKFIFLFNSPEDCSRFMCEMLENYGEKYEFDRSWDFEAEMHTKGSGKGDAVKFLRNYFGDKVNRVICVGDYENDISMLIEADEGIAVNNAIDSVKKAADRVTVCCEEHALKKIIEEL